MSLHLEATCADIVYAKLALIKIEADRELRSCHFRL